ncbi:hypothetical protein [Lachnotalea glycerini]|uniref:hypothetical protein n=1 Tax=Lachnotalea glycerini TaxID=1763509 RepID=UPI0015F24BA6|nr:hypothetical protein [Lachnotalea glycerini]
MQEIFEEYGEFVMEGISGVLLLWLLVYFFQGLPMTSMIHNYVLSVLGGGV